MAEQTPVAYLKIPKPRRVVFGAILLTGFLLFFVFLAAYNLIHLVAMIPSTLWLLLVGTVFFGSCKERGAKTFLTEILGAFSAKEFTRAIRRDDQNEIQFGFEMFGRGFLYFKLPVKKIESVNWSTGQATHLAGRDMKDWQVSVWYDHDDLVKSQKHQKWRKPDQEIYLVGPTTEKEKTAAFGLTFVELLRKSGATLVQGGNECTFVR